MLCSKKTCKFVIQLHVRDFREYVVGLFHTLVPISLTKSYGLPKP